MTTAKAEGRSISFNPSTLYDRAKTYGESLENKLNPSEVTCIALTEYLDRVAPEKESDLNVAVAQIREAAVKDPSLGSEILQFIRDRKRTRKAGK